ncbi:thiamine biosynthesis protein ThiS [candidate division LCP-89 bacterium B3_LCP]|uniref:Thiamine biosynthesis protein ThiS n=1 Tax=candidate division LCP-89 bacterium B3_LCP TaxID=2012998 RepID=A0A532V267_UNCL8|nr:MAG: thiamine biosynthesis protein ThiS [candidate division LCP-89 bacterium B3_LCP]
MSCTKDLNMRITINGTSREVSEDVSLSSLLEELDLNANTTVVELNREVVKKSVYPEVKLADGDILELVRFVGGG